MLWPDHFKQEAAPDLKVQLLTLSESDLDRVVAVEQTVYSHPWTLGNFKDALKSGYAAFKLEAGEHLIGYLVAMQVIDEVHLLNITVAPAFQRQGWAHAMLQFLNLWSLQKEAQCLWLEVRQSNRARFEVVQSFWF
jgi:ribosomal-protein-alanine N-acetyltransferase